MILRLVLLVLATLWVWETLRFALERYLSQVFAATRVVHPLVVAALPLYVLWPDWVSALGVAGATGIAVLLVDRTFGPPEPPVVIPRRRAPGSLPPLP